MNQPHIRELLARQSNPLLLEIPEEVRQIVAPVVRGLRSGNNETFYMVGMRVNLAATKEYEDSGPNIGQSSGQT